MAEMTVSVYGCALQQKASSHFPWSWNTWSWLFAVHGPETPPPAWLLLSMVLKYRPPLLLLSMVLKHRGHGCCCPWYWNTNQAYQNEKNCIHTLCLVFLQFFPFQLHDFTHIHTYIHIYIHIHTYIHIYIYIFFYITFQERNPCNNIQVCYGPEYSIFSIKF